MTLETLSSSPINIKDLSLPEIVRKDTLASKWGLTDDFFESLAAPDLKRMHPHSCYLVETIFDRELPLDIISILDGMDFNFVESIGDTAVRSTDVPILSRLIRIKIDHPDLFAKVNIRSNQHAAVGDAGIQQFPSIADRLKEDIENENGLFEKLEKASTLKFLSPEDSEVFAQDTSFQNKSRSALEAVTSHNPGTVEKKKHAIRMAASIKSIFPGIDLDSSKYLYLGKEIFKSLQGSSRLFEEFGDIALSMMVLEAKRVEVTDNEVKFVLEEDEPVELVEIPERRRF